MASVKEMASVMATVAAMATTIHSVAVVVWNGVAEATRDTLYSQDACAEGAAGAAGAAEGAEGACVAADVSIDDIDVVAISTCLVCVAALWWLWRVMARLQACTSQVAALTALFNARQVEKESEMKENSRILIAQLYGEMRKIHDAIADMKSEMAEMQEDITDMQ